MSSEASSAENTNGVVKKPSAIVSKETLVSTRWLSLSTLTYTDPLGVARKWDVAERATRPSTGVDGVEIIAVLEHKSKPENSEKKILAVLQFRPPLGQLSLELPAGLIDEGENAETAALRELIEETGYHGELISSSPILGLDAGMSSSNAKVVHVSVDLDKPENANPVSHQEDGEFIETFLIPTTNMLQFIEDLCTKRNAVCDAKLYTFAWAKQFSL